MWIEIGEVSTTLEDKKLKSSHAHITKIISIRSVHNLIIKNNIILAILEKLNVKNLNHNFWGYGWIISNFGYITHKPLTNLDKN